MHSKDNGWATEEKYQDSEENEAVDGDYVVVRELGPWTDGSEPDEDGDVEQHVNGGLKGVVHCFEAEPVAGMVLATSNSHGSEKLGYELPGKDVTGDKTRQHVVTTNHAACADDEKLV